MLALRVGALRARIRMHRESARRCEAAVAAAARSGLPDSWRDSAMQAQQSATRIRWFIIGPFLAVVVLLAALGVASAQILSAVRAYVGGESLWSKGQKDAVYHLSNYLESRRDSR
jgi:hypothetical protein